MVKINSFISFIFLGLLVVSLFQPASALGATFFKAVTFTPEFYAYYNDKALGTARFKGVVKLSEDEKIGNAWFEWGDSSNMNGITSSRVIRRGENLIDVSVRDLESDKYYYYRMAAQDSNGTVMYGDIIRFRISDGTVTNLGQGGLGIFGGASNSGNFYQAPTVTTLSVQVINGTSVILKGMTETNASITTSGYFRWGTTPSTENQTAVKNLGTSPTLTFQEVLTGLTPGATYYYKAEAVNPGGRVSGATLSFRTTGGVVVPVVGSSRPTGAVSNNSAPSTPVKEEEPKEEEQTASVFSSRFFPGTIFGWIIITILLTLFAAVIVYLKTLQEQLKDIKEEREERRKNGNNLYTQRGGVSTLGK